MICVTIAQESRRLALADMLNASMLGADLLEVRLDTLDNAPNFAEMLSAKRKPLLFSCKRKQDGGQWQGTEEERLMLLRQAVLSKADYVEIELDAADQIRPFPGCGRVISYTNLTETPADIADMVDEIKTKKPDVIKLTCKARTPEEAWPLVQLLPKATVPTVVVGLGRPGVMIAILGRKIGAPWTVAALEKGMEAYPGQPTVRDLEEVYAYREIDKATKLVGVTGLSEEDFLRTGLLNEAFRSQQSNARCWPLQIGNPKLFRKIIEAVKLQGVAVENDFLEQVHEVAFLDPTARAPVQAADWIQPGKEGWEGSNLVGDAAVECLREAFKAKGEVDDPFKSKSVVVAGVGPMTRMVLPKLKEAGLALIVASKDKALGQRTVQTFSGRFIAWEAVYQTFHDVLVLDREASMADEEMPLHPGYLRQGMIVLDLRCGAKPNQFLHEAKLRGCVVVTPRDWHLARVAAMTKRMTGSECAYEPLHEKWAAWVPEGE